MSIICFLLISRIQIHPAILTILCKSCGISMQYFPISNTFDFFSAFETGATSNFYRQLIWANSFNPTSLEINEEIWTVSDKGRAVIVCTNGLINRLSLKGPYNSDYEQSLMFLREIRPMEILELAWKTAACEESSVLTVFWWMQVVTGWKISRYFLNQSEIKTFHDLLTHFPALAPSCFDRWFVHLLGTFWMKSFTIIIIFLM